MGGYKACDHTTYIVRWGDIWKVGYSAQQRWRKFACRGAEVVQLTAFDNVHDALGLESDLLRDLAARGHRAFASKADAEPYLGRGGGGWLECFCLCGVAMHPHDADALHGRTAPAVNDAALRPLPARTNAEHELTKNLPHPRRNLTLVTAHVAGEPR